MRFATVSVGERGGVRHYDRRAGAPRGRAVSEARSRGRGKGVHFSNAGLRAHAAVWMEKIAPWLEEQTPRP